MADTPSEFWRELGDEHRQALDEHGYDGVKRHQALRYFTWQWRWSQLRRSEQARFLARHATLGDWRGALRRPGPLDDTTWHGPMWGVRDRRLYVAATRLLWRYAERKGDRAVLALPEPTVGDPLPVHLDGRLISQDLANTALEVDAMRRGGATGPTSIVEIGAGYGRTAYALLALHPKATYTIVDIEPALSISRWYLSQLVDPARVSFVDAGDIGTVRDRRFDLGVSISSLQEMTPDQVGEYLELLDCIVDGHVYLKQWETWHNPIDDVDLVFDQYRIPSRWQRTLWERCPVQTRFMQGVWQT